MFEDARDSPLEKRISDSIVKPKDNANLFSLVPSGVPRPPAIVEASNPGPIFNPDSFSDFFRLLGESCSTACHAHNDVVGADLCFSYLLSMYVSSCDLVVRVGWNCLPLYLVDVLTKGVLTRFCGKEQRYSS